MSFFTRSPLSADLRRELHDARPQAGRVHAAGTAPDLVVAACTECLALRRMHDGALEWEFIGWHLIARGGWNGERQALRWTLVDGEEHDVHLDDPGQVPEVFRDRVQASIVVEHVVPAPGGGHVAVAGRRELGVEDAPVVWQVTTSGAARLTDPAVAEFARATAIDVQAQYEV